MTVAAIEAQQKALNSLVQEILQNRRASDVLTAKVSSTCAMLNETCCVYINTSRLVGKNLEKIKQNIHLFNKFTKREILNS